MEKSPDEKRRVLEKSMGEPIGLEYQEDVLKTRRNLLVIGSISILVCLADLEIQVGQTGNSSLVVYGVGLSGLNQHVLLWCMFLATSYLLIHFLWASKDAMSEYQLRRTGARLHYQVGGAGFFGPEDIESPKHPRQATLYLWWLEESRNLGDLPESFLRAEDELGKYIAKLTDLQQSMVGAVPASILNEARAISNNGLNEVKAVKALLERRIKLLDSPRISVSLERFDSAFGRRAISQNARWIIIDFSVPVIVGLFGYVMIFDRIAPQWRYIFQ